MTRSSQRHPDISLSVKMDLGTSQRSRAALKALIPDNLNFPKGLSLKMFSRGSMISIRISATAVAAETVVSTLDEILEHIAMCQKVMPR
jgi:hypothetical protein